MSMVDLDIVDVIKKGGFLACFSTPEKRHFVNDCQLSVMKSAFLYTATLNLFNIEICIPKKQRNGYETIDNKLSKNINYINYINLSDYHGIMKTTFNDLLQSNTILLLPEYTIKQETDIEQIEIEFNSGTTIIYQNSNLPPAMISNKLKNLILE